MLTAGFGCLNLLSVVNRLDNKFMCNEKESDMKMMKNISIIKYRISMWMFNWNKDEDGDIVFTFAKVFHFAKYKESTIIGFGRKNYQKAPKYVKC